jgi:hypothetical protein
LVVVARFLGLAAFLGETVLGEETGTTSAADMLLSETGGGEDALRAEG